MTSRLFKLPILVLLLLCFVWLANGCAGNLKPGGYAQKQKNTNTYSTPKSTYHKTTYRKSAPSYNNATLDPAHPGTLHYNNLPAYNAIDVSGPVKVKLRNRQHKQTVTLSGPNDALRAIDVYVSGRTLIINAPRVKNQKQLQPVIIDVDMAQPLTRLTTHGNVVVWANNVNSPGLVVSTHDNSAVHLGNVGGLVAIENDSSQDMQLSGINSERLVVGGRGKGRILVTGRTRILDAKLADSFCLEAQGLVAKEVYILTTDHALAYICPTERLYAFAYKDSDIYYYEIPGQLVRETRMSGNVLKLPNR